MKKDINGLSEQEFLRQYDATSYERPSISIDNLLFVINEIENDDIRKLNEKRLQVLLIKRDSHPYLNQWSLPGAFVKMTETLEETSIKCLEDKANLSSSIYLEQLYTFGEVKRDPRTRVLSIAYMGLVDKKSVKIKEKSMNTSWFTLKILDGEILFEEDNGLIVRENDLAFDHAKIINYGLSRIKNKLEYTDIAFSLLGEEFTMAELQQVYEVLLDKRLTKANFQRKIKDRVVSTGKYKTGGFRPALLYKYKGDVI